jgi:nucleoside 2-deoxyribosyltransferase
VSRPSVYLAGPITGLTYADGAEWREVAKAALDDAGIDGFSPLRMKQYLEAFGVLEAKDQDGKYNYEGAHPLSSDKGIMARDRNDVMRRDLTIANLLGAEKVSIGTCIEIGWADAYRKPLILVMEDDNVHRHAMAEEAAGYRVHTLDEAIEIAKAVLLP